MYTGLLPSGRALATSAVRAMPFFRGSRVCLGRCVPSQNMQNRIPCSRHSATSSIVARLRVTSRAPSRAREIGRIRRKRRIFRTAGFRKMSARAPKSVASFQSCRMTSASIRVLQWFGASSTEPSRGTFSFPSEWMALNRLRVALSHQTLAQEYFQSFS